MFGWVCLCVCLLCVMVIRSNSKSNQQPLYYQFIRSFLYSSILCAKSYSACYHSPREQHREQKVTSYLCFPLQGMTGLCRHLLDVGVYRVQFTPSGTHQQIHCCYPDTLPTFKRSSADYSQPILIIWIQPHETTSIRTAYTFLCAPYPSFCPFSHVSEFLNNLQGLGTEQEQGCRILTRQATQPGGIGSLESILGLLKSLKIRALTSCNWYICITFSLSGYTTQIWSMRVWVQRQNITRSATRNRHCSFSIYAITDRNGLSDAHQCFLHGGGGRRFLNGVVADYN